MKKNIYIFKFLMEMLEFIIVEKKMDCYSERIVILSETKNLKLRDTSLRSV